MCARSVFTARELRREEKGIKGMEEKEIVTKGIEILRIMVGVVGIVLLIGFLVKGEKF
mgnify:CR=1 FL=1